MKSLSILLFFLLCAFLVQDVNAMNQNQADKMRHLKNKGGKGKGGKGKGGKGKGYCDEVSSSPSPVSNVTVTMAPALQPTNSTGKGKGGKGKGGKGKKSCETRAPSAISNSTQSPSTISNSTQDFRDIFNSQQSFNFNSSDSHQIMWGTKMKIAFAVAFGTYFFWVFA